MDKETYKKMRKMIISIILATDMSQHFTLINKLKAKLERKFHSNNEEDLTVALFLYY